MGFNSGFKGLINQSKFRSPHFSPS